MNLNPEDLLIKYISGECTKEERLVVDRWTRISISNQDELNRVRRIWDLNRHAGFEPDIDAAWQKVNANADKNAMTVSYRKPRFSLKWVSGIAASISLLIIAFWLLLDPFTPSLEVIRTADQRIESTLPDGSKVWLKENSTLGYSFEDSKERLLELSGEAFFEVAKMPERPFTISLGEAEIEVIGTSFYAKSLKNEDYQVSVKSGVVAFRDADHAGKNVTLKANEEAILKRSSGDMVKRTIADPNVMAWQTGILVFNKTPLRVVIKELTDYYKTSINLKTEAMGDCLITSRFDNQPLAEVLEIIKKLISAELIQTEEGFILSGQGC